MRNNCYNKNIEAMKAYWRCIMRPEHEKDRMSRDLIIMNLMSIGIIVLCAIIA